MLRISHIILVVKEGKKLACFRGHESYYADLATERERSFDDGKGRGKD